MWPGGPNSGALRVVGPPKAWQAGSSALVGLGLDDASRRRRVEQRAPDQVNGDGPRRPVEERGSERRSGRAAHSDESAPRLAAASSSWRATAVGRRPPARELRVQPRALGKDLVVLLVEQLREAGELIGGDLGEVDALVERVADQPADDAVSLAERQPAADEQVGDVGGGAHLVGGGGGHPLAVELDARAAFRRATAGRARSCRRRRTAAPCPPGGPCCRRAGARAARRPASPGRPAPAAPSPAAARPRRGSSSAA